MIDVDELEPSSSRGGVPPSPDRWRDPDTTREQPGGAPPVARRPYVPPELRWLGTLRTLTLGSVPMPHKPSFPPR